MIVYLFATLDTKGPEAAFVRDRLLSLGVDVKIVDTGCIGEPTIPADISRLDVFQSAGSSLDELRQKNDHSGQSRKRRMVCPQSTALANHSTTRSPAKHCLKVCANIAVILI
jgi:uncharacterized protein (UPF0261 family)